MSSYTFPGQLAAFHVMTHHRQPSWPRLGLDIKSFVVVVVFNSCKMWHHPSPMVGTWRVSRHSPPETAAMNTDTHISSWTGGLRLCRCSGAQSCPTLCDPMDCNTPGFPVLHHLPEFAQTHLHRVGDAIQPSRSLLPPSPPALNLAHHQDLLVSVGEISTVG